MNRYQKIIDYIFRKGLAKDADATEIPFDRQDLTDAATALSLGLLKNLGDIVYAFRYRDERPPALLAAQPEGLEWVIKGKGRGKYAFVLVAYHRILPNPLYLPIKIPDSTPEIVLSQALTDEQALLAKLRYNRLIDLFLGITAYSLQNHLRTSVKNLGQVEIDEVYIGVDRNGAQYIVPVQAKGGKDQLSTVQTSQDIACCSEKFPNLICRPISAQFIDSQKICLFELTTDEEGSAKIIDEKHYLLVPSDQISPEDLATYQKRSQIV